MQVIRYASVAAFGVLMLPAVFAETADVIYTNGKIYTVNQSTPWAEAVAIKGDRFIGVGSNEDIQALGGDETRVIDLSGKFVMPGIHDAHLHFESAYQPAMLGDKMLRLGAEHDSIEKVQKAIKAYADANPDIPVLFIEQLPLSLFPGNDPTNAFIDEVVPDRAVVMYGDQEHEVVLNRKALEIEGVTKETPTPPNGEIFKDPSTGEPTGLLKEEAAGKWGIKYYPTLSREKHQQGLKATIDYLLSIGIVGGKQQHAKPPVAIAFKDLADADELKLRVALSWTWRGPLEPMPLDQQEKNILDREQYAHELINVDFVKFSIDGVPGATGYVLEPYEKIGGNGLAFYSSDLLVADISRFDQMGLGITAHTMGDAGSRQLLDALEQVKTKQGKLNGRHQLAHASMVHPDDHKRLAELNLTPEYSPVLWFPAPVVMGYSEALGTERLNSLWPMRSLHEAGARTVIGSDGPLFWQPPLTTLELAVTRKAPGEPESEALGESEALDLDTAIQGMTLNAAYLLGFDQSSGSIEVGKYADMLVLNQNLFEIPSHQISATEILQTVFGGTVVFDSVNSAASLSAIEEEHGVLLSLNEPSGHMGCFLHHLHGDEREYRLQKFADQLGAGASLSKVESPPANPSR